MIINVRGTMGSGKTTIMRGLIASFWKRTMYGRLGAVLPEAYKLQIPNINSPVFILGPYVAQNGGCDRIQSTDLIMELIEDYHGMGHVLFEHLGLSACYGKVGELIAKHHGVLAYMDTPLEQCVANVRTRRAARGEKKPFDPDRYHKKHFAAVQRSRERALDIGKVKVVDLNFGKGREQILAMLST